MTEEAKCEVSPEIEIYRARLHKALEYRGHLSGPEKIRFLMEITGKSRRTVIRWLTGERKPFSFPDAKSILEGLDVTFDWLFCGIGTIDDALFLRWAKSLNQWERHKFLRLIVRLKNKNAKAERLQQMYFHGQITRTQLFSMM